MDAADYTYNWACPKCGKLITETDPGLLEAKIKTHKCEEKKIEKS
jgi:hypothetical protein